MRPIRCLVLLLVALVAGEVAAQSPLQREAFRIGSVPADRSLRSARRAPALDLPAWTDRVDPALRSLWLADASPTARQRRAAPVLEAEPVAVTYDASGEPLVELFVQTDDPAGLAAVPGVEVRAVAGDVAVVRAAVDALPGVAERAGVRFVEAARVRRLLNDGGREDVRADVVQAGGGGLPRAFRGEGVVVGVLDSGLDVTHPDFQSASGTRVRYLLEYLDGGGQRSWTKAQIDADPAAVTERDGNGGGGHGTHVTGTAAGNGAVMASQRGMAPAADIVFVKGVRDPDSNGGFADADVISGVDAIFQQAAAFRQPAVVNLSLGGHFGSHDGTSLYEQALSNLGGPGRIIIAAAGNEGFSFIHAGEVVQANVLNETIWFANGPTFAGATLWYDAGSLSEFSVGAYRNNNGSLEWLGAVGVDAGQALSDPNGQGVPFVVDGVTLGYVSIDARTTADPRNGDGNVLFSVEGTDGVDIQNVVWSILTSGTRAGRVDLWALQSEFLAREIGFPNQNEIPGDTRQTVGVPSTALGVIAVGSHVTGTSWTDVDGVGRQWSNPHPTHDPNAPSVVPDLGQRSYFSSLGPTRDGRTSPDITAPGELIFSTRSSHTTPGTGHTSERALVLQGGAYLGMQGTSMASPHVTGIVALMLQADPSLTPAEVRAILQATARTDGFTGTVPNDAFGAGKVDALAAVLRTLDLCGTACSGGVGGGTGTTVSEAEPNNAPAQAQDVGAALPITISGTAENTDAGTLGITFTGGTRDDLEDLYLVTTSGPGLTLSLSGYTQDLDLYLLDRTAASLLGSSNSVEPTETIDLPDLPAGTYLVGISFYDAGSETGSTAYTLTASSAGTAVASDDRPEGDVVLYPVAPNPVRSRAAVEFELAQPADVRLSLYDVLGREVRMVAEGARPAGPGAIALDAAGLSPGSYVLRLVAGAESRTQRMTIVR